MYFSLSLWLSNDKDLDEFSPPSEIYLSKNDKRHIRQLIEYLRKYPIEDILSQFRLFMQLVEERINFAKSSLLEITSRSSDVYVKDIIRSWIDNDADAKIIMDAFEWSQRIDAPSFLTIDVGDIYRNKKSIIKALKDYKYLDDDPFRILHIRDLIG